MRCCSMPLRAGTGEFRVRSKVSAQASCGSSARDWAEAGGGVRLPAWNNGAVTVSVTTSITSNQTTTYVSRLVVVQAF